MGIFVSLECICFLKTYFKSSILKKKINGVPPELNLPPKFLSGFRLAMNMPLTISPDFQVSKAFNTQKSKFPASILLLFNSVSI